MVVAGNARHLWSSNAWEFLILDHPGPDHTSSSYPFCDASNERCSEFPACSIADGSMANSATNCSCGLTDCDASTGYFCYAEKSVCSPSAENFSAFLVHDAGHCTDTNLQNHGYSHVEDVTTCEAGSAKVGWATQPLLTSSNASYPTGCSLCSSATLCAFLLSEKRCLAQTKPQTRCVLWKCHVFAGQDQVQSAKTKMVK